MIRIMERLVGEIYTSKNYGEDLYPLFYSLSPSLSLSLFLFLSNIQIVVFLALLIFASFKPQNVESFC